MTRPSRHIRIIGMMVTMGVFLVSSGCRRAAPPVQPARIVSGSMAERYWGEHWWVTCDDCGYSFRCGVEHPPAGIKAVCPNCGYAENKIDAADVQPGMAVDVVPRDFSTDPPHRYEVIAFDEPGSDHVAVKRVIGLPGERVAIREGDIFIDGRRLQKSLAEFEELERRVYTPLFSPQSFSGSFNRWRPAADASRWEELAWEADGGTFHCDGRQQDAREFDWLEYHHQSGAATPAPRTAPARVLDHSAYNQGLSRQLNAMSDVGVGGVVQRISDGGELRIRLVGGARPLAVAFLPQENAVRLDHGEEEIAQAPVSTPLVGNSPWTFSVNIVDRRVLVGVDGIETLAFDLDDISLEFGASDLSLALGCRGLDVQIINPQISRDIYYLNPHHRPDDWELESPLGEGEYFLLGDNPPNSRDSRHYGAVKQAALVGSVPHPAD